jgi:hypothetical protein
MASFKHKPDKLKYLSNINTLDETHRKYANDFEKRRSQVAEKKKMVTVYQKELNALENKNKELYTTEDSRRRAFIKQELSRLDDDIFDVDNDISELDYYSRTNDILMDYYNIIDDSHDHNHDDHIYEDDGQLPSIKEGVGEGGIDENIEISSKLEELNLKSQRKRKMKRPTRKRTRRVDSKSGKTILQFFGDNKLESEASEITEQSEDPDADDSEIPEESEQFGVVIEHVVSNRASLFDDYLMMIDRGYASSKTKVCPIRMCTNCNVEKSLNQQEGAYICHKCGEVEHIIIESEVPNHKESLNEKPRYPYKRLNHLVELVSYFVIKKLNLNPVTYIKEQ